jgi:hypothetical protein
MEVILELTPGPAGHRASTHISVTLTAHLQLHQFMLKTCDLSLTNFDKEFVVW